MFTVEQSRTVRLAAAIFIFGSLWIVLLELANRVVDTIPTIAGIPVELKQLLTNLIFNAVESLPRGGRIEVRLSANEENVVMEVIDNGVGMSTTDQQRCFEPFFTTKVYGTGLGMTVCRGLVERHAGQIAIESNLGKGTTVRVTLPVGAPLPISPAIEETLIFSGTTKRVLYIDDDDLVRESMRALFMSLGVQADVVEDGATALRLLSANIYGLVMTDVGMTDINGFDIIRAVKSQNPNLPVVLVSGWSQADVRARMQSDYASNSR